MANSVRLFSDQKFVKSVDRAVVVLEDLVWFEEMNHHPHFNETEISDFRQAVTGQTTVASMPEAVAVRYLEWLFEIVLT
jgi:hypothetical protein